MAARKKSTPRRKLTDKPAERRHSDDRRIHVDQVDSVIASEYRSERGSERPPVMDILTHEERIARGPYSHELPPGVDERDLRIDSLEKHVTYLEESRARSQRIAHDALRATRALAAVLRNASILANLDDQMFFPKRAPVTISVVGDPAPKGSKRAFVMDRGAGRKGEPGYRPPRAVVTDSTIAKDRLSPWKIAISAAVQNYIASDPGFVPFEGAIDVTMTFFLPRPASAKPKKVRYPIRKPDWDKLARAAGDCCNKTLWADDARIVSGIVLKRFADTRPPGLVIEVRETEI